ncbi:MAG TPA: hypothetical protein VN132_07280 [Bdellovibrio sp.]|nr:hypothetical protein [Bdellovibrio sp.]
MRSYLIFSVSLLLLPLFASARNEAWLPQLMIQNDIAVKAGTTSVTVASFSGEIRGSCDLTFDKAEWNRVIVAGMKFSIHSRSVTVPTLESYVDFVQKDFNVDLTGKVRSSDDVSQWLREQYNMSPYFMITAELSSSITEAGPKLICILNSSDLPDFGKFLGELQNGDSSLKPASAF